MEGKARPPRVFSASGGGENTNYKGARECLQQRPTRARRSGGSWEAWVGVHVKRCGEGGGGGGGRGGVILADGCVSSDPGKDSFLVNVCSDRGGRPVHGLGWQKSAKKKIKRVKNEEGEAATSSRRRQRRHCE